MKTETPLQELLRREVSRKEFLVTVALGCVSVLGFSSIIRLLTGKDISQAGSGRSGKVGHGYSFSAYGK